MIEMTPCGPALWARVEDGADAYTGRVVGWVPVVSDPDDPGPCWRAVVTRDGSPNAVPVRVDARVW